MNYGRVGVRSKLSSTSSRLLIHLAKLPRLPFSDLCYLCDISVMSHGNVLVL